MAWRTQMAARPGEYLLARTTGGLSVDLFGAVNHIDLWQRIMARADGWTVLDVRIVRRLFSADVTVLGQAQRDVLTDAVRSDVAGALNSYWTVAGADVTVWVGDDAGAALPAEIDQASDWSSTLKWVSVAVIAAAIVYGLIQIRRLA